MVAGLHLYSFCGLFNMGRAIKREITVHCVSSFGTWTSICVTIKPEIFWKYGEGIEKQHWHPMWGHSSKAI